MFPTYTEGRLQNIVCISVSIHALYKREHTNIYTHAHRHFRGCMKLLILVISEGSFISSFYIFYFFLYVYFYISYYEKALLYSWKEMII